MGKDSDQLASLFRDVVEQLSAGNRIAAEAYWNVFGQEVFKSSNYKFRPGIHPHEFSCLRACYYSAKSIERRPPSPDPRMLVGRALHNEINFIMKSALGDSYIHDVPVDDTEFGREYGIAGEADGLFLHEGKPVLGLEIKTGTVPTSPFQAHIYQLGLYQLCLKPPFFALWYISRDGDKSKVFFFQQEHLSAVKSRLFDLLAMIDSGELPPAEGSWFTCRYCPYSYLCLKEGMDAKDR